MLAHKASHEGRVAVEVIAGENVAFAPRAIPAVVFTDPELAWCGLTEAQAQKESRKVTIAKFPWGASGRAHHARSHRRPDQADSRSGDRADSRRRPGRPGAGELIAEGVLAIEMGANATDLKLSIHPHPTLTETLMESAEVFFGQATHVYRPQALDAGATRSHPRRRALTAPGRSFTRDTARLARASSSDRPGTGRVVEPEAAASACGASASCPASPRTPRARRRRQVISAFMNSTAPDRDAVSTLSAFRR